jgi:hypothetical protein
VPLVIGFARLLGQGVYARVSPVPNTCPWRLCPGACCQMQICWHSALSLRSRPAAQNHDHSCTAAIEEPVSIRTEPRPELVSLQRHAWAYLLQPVCKHGMGRLADIGAYHCGGRIVAAGCEHHGQILRQALPIRLVRLDSARKIARVTAR